MVTLEQATAERKAAAERGDTDGFTVWRAREEVLREADFDPVKHPRGRGGKFRDVLGKLASITPGHSKTFSFGMVTRGFGDDKHTFALQHGGSLTKRGSAEDVAGHVTGQRGATSVTPGRPRKTESKLEGPFTYPSGWKGRYDPKEGRYLGMDDVYMPRDFDPHTGHGAMTRGVESKPGPRVTAGGHDPELAKKIASLRPGKSLTHDGVTIKRGKGDSYEKRHYDLSHGEQPKKNVAVPIDSPATGVRVGSPESAAREHANIVRKRGESEQAPKPDDAESLGRSIRSLSDAGLAQNERTWGSAPASSSRTKVLAMIEQEKGRRGKTEHVWSESAVENAKSEIKRHVMAKFGGDLMGPALKSVEVSNADAVAYLNGTSIEDILKRARSR